MARFVSVKNTLINLDRISHITFEEGDRVAIAYTNHKGEAMIAYGDKHNASIESFLKEAVFGPN